MKHNMQRKTKQNTLIRMRAIACGPPSPLWYTKRHTHTHTLTDKYLVCNRIRRNLKAQKHLQGAYCYRHGNKLRNSTIKEWKKPTIPPKKVRQTSSQLSASGLQTQPGSNPRLFAWIKKKQKKQKKQDLRWDWETILVRLRPRESTWLETLLAVVKGCLVRTRPGWNKQPQERKTRFTNKSQTPHDWQSPGTKKL